ncbi:MAG: hypothetical protein KDA41_15710 [Planctomycetales bacterium]|nr:hypothetical protein [Planctomycetales bacterium]
MHPIEHMKDAAALAERLGWRIRYEYLGEVGGGACEVGGRKLIFVDVALSPLEQFHQVIEAIRDDAAVHTVDVPACLAPYLELRRAA